MFQCLWVNLVYFATGDIHVQLVFPTENIEIFLQHKHKHKQEYSKISLSGQKTQSDQQNHYNLSTLTFNFHV